MHKSATKCNKTIGKWYKNKHGASKIIDTLETYQWLGPKLARLLPPPPLVQVAWASPQARYTRKAGKIRKVHYKTLFTFNIFERIEDNYSVS
jgi:hypothetical protein